MKRARRDWGMVFLGLAAGFALGEVKQIWQPNQMVAWVLGVLTLACLLAGFYLMRNSKRGG